MRQRLSLSDTSPLTVADGALLLGPDAATMGTPWEAYFDFDDATVQMGLQQALVEASLPAMRPPGGSSCRAREVR